MFENFIFNGAETKTYNVACVNYNNTISNENIINSLELKTQLISNQNRYVILNKTLNSQRSIDVQLMKLDRTRFSTLDQETIINWLCKDNYGKLYIDNPGYENIYFNVIFTYPKLIDNVILQFTLYFESTYGNTDINKDFVITNKGQKIYIGVNSKYNKITFPKVIISECNGNLEIISTNSIESNITKISDCTDDEIITMDSYLCVIDTTNKSHNIFNCFNKKWIYMINGENYLTINTPCKITISYIQQRMVAI